MPAVALPVMQVSALEEVSSMSQRTARLALMPTATRLYLRC
jgi:hypothetical protein